MKSKVKMILLSALFLFSMLLVQVDVEGSAGKLKASSICTARNGVKYGNHGNGHWHRAKKYKSGWYPQGRNLGKKNPCRKR